MSDQTRSQSVHAIESFIKTLTRDGSTPTQKLGEFYRQAAGVGLVYKTPTVESSIIGIVDGFRNILEALQGKKGPPDANDFVRANSMTAPPSGPGIYRR